MSKQEYDFNYRDKHSIKLKDKASALFEKYLGDKILNNSITIGHDIGIRYVKFSIIVREVLVPNSKGKYLGVSEYFKAIKAIKNEIAPLYHTFNWAHLDFSLVTCGKYLYVSQDCTVIERRLHPQHKLILSNKKVSAGISGEIIIDIFGLHPCSSKGK